MSQCLGHVRYNWVNRHARRTGTGAKAVHSQIV